MTLTPRQVADYRRDGYLFPLPAIGAEGAARYRRALEAHEAKTGKPLQGNWRHKSHLLFTWCADLVRDARILDAVEPVLGPDILCWSVNFFIKEKASPGFVSWHQDATYWGLEPHDVLTAWVAFTDSDLHNGCMRFLPGSHRGEQLAHVDTFHKDNLLSRGQEIAVAVDDAKGVDCRLKAGEMSFHHVKLVHGSGPNPSDDRRIGLAIRYVPTHVRQIGVRDSATLVRGADRHGNFDLEPRPRSDLDAAALAAHQDAVGRQVSNLYKGTSKTEFRA
jgi:ectoine hydroxylase-related dioxygenase (phytanoyl-CoA dioxygenase family)